MFKDENICVSIADIVLYQLLGFTDRYCGVDVTLGTGEGGKYVYGRDAKSGCSNSRKLYQAFSRRSARGGDELRELAVENASEKMGFGD